MQATTLKRISTLLPSASFLPFLPLLLLLQLPLLLTGCKGDDLPAPSGDSGNTVPEQPAGVTVRFQLPSEDLPGFGARNSFQLPSETKVKRLLAVAFDDNDKNPAEPGGSRIATEDDEDVFYTVVPIDLPAAQPIGVDMSLLSFGLGKEGNFQICFVANASEDLTQALLDWEPGCCCVGDFKDLLVEQDPGTVIVNDEGDGLFMTSAYMELETSFTHPSFMGLVELYRAMARIDVENAAGGMEITRIEFYNRANRTVLFNDSNTRLTPEMLQDSPEVYDLSLNPLKGDETNPARFFGEIYSYEQFASEEEADRLPYLDITYRIPSVSKDRKYVHRVGFRRAGADGQMQVLPLRRNTLYRIRMYNESGKLHFALGVDDWEKGEPVDVGSDDLIDGMEI